MLREGLVEAEASDLLRFEGAHLGATCRPGCEMEGALIQIEKGIPFPKSWSKFPIRDMEVGDSFFVPDIVRTSEISGQIGQAARAAGMKVSTRKVEGGVRVWRLA